MGVADVANLADVESSSGEEGGLPSEDEGMGIEHLMVQGDLDNDGFGPAGPKINWMNMPTADPVEAWACGKTSGRARKSVIGKLFGWMSAQGE